MGARGTLKITLIAALVLAAGATWWSLSSRRAAGDSAPAGEVLESGVSRKSTDFRHSEFKLGKRLFQVESTVDTLTAEGRHQLDEVQLTVFDELGRPSDRISAESAIYAVEDKRIRFEGQVEIQLSDGTRIQSDRLRADLAGETVRIDQPFRFQRDSVSGGGSELIYRISRKELEIGGGFRMTDPSPASPIAAASSSALYELAASQLTLSGDASLSGRDFQLAGERMRLAMTPERRLKRIVDWGGATLVSAGKSFAGDRINISFQVDSGRVRDFQVLSAENGAKAVYEEKGPRGRRLEARKISGLPNPALKDPSRLQLEAFRAEGEAVFASPAMGVDQASTERLDGAFDSQGRLRQLNMSGGASIVRVQEQRRETLRSRRLQLDFDQAERIEKGIARGDAELSLKSPRWTRRHSARDFVAVDFEEGELARITSSADCFLETVDSSGSTLVRSPQMLALYSDGVIDRFFAGDGVQIQTASGESAQRSESRQLRIFYARGKMQRIVHSGQFQYWDETPARQVNLSGDQAVYRPETGAMTVTGEESQPLLRQSSTTASDGWTDARTSADRFDLNRETGAVEARGRVVTEIDEGDNAVRLEAGAMRAEPQSGWADYFQNPRVTQPSGTVSAQRIRLYSEDRTLLADGEVESFFSSGEDDKLTRYWVSADRLRLVRSENRAVYEGNVSARSGELRLLAPRLELTFEGDLGSLREAVASGGVQVADATRTAVGDTAYYEPLLKRIRVVGDRARVTDAKQGRASGSELLFYLGDDRILIEGPAKRQP